mmetsp:Transcript_28494/g.45626  ORF Transcript_28494/g.45626 Transcript_28494/m.45626 type:complete len:385 (+) Transcript_28494:469-1623(+)
MTALAVRGVGPFSPMNSLTRSHRSLVPMGNFWLHALSSSFTSASSLHGALTFSPLHAACLATASSAAALRSSLLAEVRPASACRSPSTTTPGSTGSAPSAAVSESASVWMETSSSALMSSSTSSSPGCPTHPSAFLPMSRRRAFSLRSAFFCFSSSFLALTLPALSASAAAAAAAAAVSASSFAASSASFLPDPFAVLRASLASFSSCFFFSTRGSNSSARSTNALIIIVSFFFSAIRFFLFSPSRCRLCPRSSADSKSCSSFAGNSLQDLNFAQNSYIFRTFSNGASGSASMNFPASCLPSKNITRSSKAGMTASKKSSDTKSMGRSVGSASTESYSRRRLESLSTSDAVCSALKRASMASFSSSVACATPHLSGCICRDSRL